MNEWTNPVLKPILCDIQDEAKLQGQITHQWWPGKGVGEGLNQDQGDFFLLLLFCIFWWWRHGVFISHDSQGCIPQSVHFTICNYISTDRDFKMKEVSRDRDYGFLSCSYSWWLVPVWSLICSSSFSNYMLSAYCMLITVDSVMNKADISLPSWISLK